MSQQLGVRSQQLGVRNKEKSEVATQNTEVRDKKKMRSAVVAVDRSEK